MPESPDKSGARDMTSNARLWYRQGVAQHYLAHAANYRNPHEPVIHELLTQARQELDLDWSRVLDLAAGSGEVSRGIEGFAPNVFAIDPFTHASYTRATARPCRELSFEQIATGALETEHFSLVICSFAMHLARASVLPSLAIALARVTPTLMILTPHKRPVIKPDWGWQLAHERIESRVRMRVYTRSVRFE